VDIHSAGGGVEATCLISISTKIWPNRAIMPEPKLASESQDQFDQLQKKLVPLWKSIQSFNQDPQTIVVRSMSVDLAGSNAADRRRTRTHKCAWGNLTFTYKVCQQGTINCSNEMTMRLGGHR
jgi:hypothetical protein